MPEHCTTERIVCSRIKTKGYLLVHDEITGKGRVLHGNLATVRGLVRTTLPPISRERLKSTGFRRRKRGTSHEIYLFDSPEVARATMEGQAVCAHSPAPGEAKALIKDYCLLRDLLGS